jgi:hypothetical protein
MGEEGPKMPLYWIWIRMRRSLREKIWIHENVPSFGLSLLIADLGSM